MDFIQDKAFWQVARKRRDFFVDLVENLFLIKFYRGKTPKDFPRLSIKRGDDAGSFLKKVSHVISPKTFNLSYLP